MINVIFFGAESSELEYIEVVLTESLEICQKYLPESHPLFISCMINLAEAKHHLTHYESAEKLLRKSLAEYEKKVLSFSSTNIQLTLQFNS